MLRTLEELNLVQVLGDWKPVFRGCFAPEKVFLRKPLWLPTTSFKQLSSSHYKLEEGFSGLALLTLDHEIPCGGDCPEHSECLTAGYTQ